MARKEALVVLQNVRREVCEAMGRTAVESVAGLALEQLDTNAAAALLDLLAPLVRALDGLESVEVELEHEEAPTSAG